MMFSQLSWSDSDCRFEEHDIFEGGMHRCVWLGDQDDQAIDSGQKTLNEEQVREQAAPSN